MSSEIAEAMVAIGAVGFRLNDPVTFKSGIKSPVYCDNRKFPFWPEQWQKVIRGFAGLVHEKGILCDVVGGIEAAGIPHSAALGFAMSKPSIFIRKEAKAHGAMKRVEGGDVAGKNVVLIEDLVTTGGSSLSAVWALREAACHASPSMQRKSRQCPARSQSCLRYCNCVRPVPSRKGCI